MGRAAELERLGEVASSGSGRCIVVTGPAGVGRTRLAREAVSAADARGRATRWVAGSSSTKGLPLGALLPLLPHLELGSSPAAMLRDAAAILTGAGSAEAESSAAESSTAVGTVATGNGAREHELVFGIDDAHLLDEMSLALVHQLAATGTVSLVLTARRPPRVPEPVSALWKDGLAERLELGGLSRAEVDRLVTSVLGGIVHSQTTERLWRASHGNVLFLHELVGDGLESGRLHRPRGVWEWEGPFAPIPRLAEVIQQHLEPLDPSEQAALDLLALGEPMEPEQLVGAAGAKVVAGLERRGLLTIEPPGARLAHPLFAEVLRAEMPHTTARTLRRRLLDDLFGSRSRPTTERAGDNGDVVASQTEVGTLCVRADRENLAQIGRLVPDGDDPHPADRGLDGGTLAQAAAHANAVLDHDLAERLARAAIAGGPGGDDATELQARLALLESTRWQGRCGEAEQIGTAASALTGEPEQHCQVAIGRALNAFFGLGRQADAEALLRGQNAPGIGHVDDACLTDDGCLRAVRGMLDFFTGRPHAPVEMSTHVETSRRTGPARAWDLAVGAASLAVVGRGTDALKAAAAGRAVLDDVPGETELPMIGLLLAHGELLALVSAGRIRDAQTRARELHDSATEDPGRGGENPIAALHVGWCDLAAGHVRTAVRWLTEAAADLESHDPTGFRPVSVAALAQAHALLGEPDAASPLVSGPSTVGHPAIVVFTPQTLLAKAWHAASTGRVPDAVTHARQAGDAAAEMGQWAVEAAALHTVVRVGRPADVADRLVELATRVEGPLVEAFAAHASSAASCSPDAGHRLDAVADGFEAMGAELLAADAAADAVRVHDQRGDRRRAADARRRAARLANRCAGVRTPALSQLLPPALTARERDAAALASRGLSNRAIAERLFLSRRTVESHLANAYGKLGVHSRADLAGALRAPDSPRVSGD